MRETMTDKRRQILDAALALCAEDGLQGAATARIAKAAGVANGTLFHHFPSKEVLIQSLYQDIKLRLGAAITETDAALPLQEQARHYWHQAMGWMQAHPRELRFVLGFFHSPLLARPLRSQILAETLHFLPSLLARGQASGELMSAPPALMLEVCQGQFLACASLFVDQPELGEDPHWQENAFTLFWSAISGGSHAP
ncbi:TetR/AcrR family transcriptional regulator [Aeromonas sp. R2-1]|uniref:TetR/AcrR family transcriptional regulator n=1 Tax=Aeromonas sp. R2-1 TaxID=3138459 RepID=UPI0034A2D3C3